MTVFIVSCEEVLYVEDISDDTVTLLAPVDGAELEFTSINFNWSAVENATGYTFQIATPNFQNSEQILADIRLDSVTQYAMELTINEYQWRIKGFNSEFETPYTMASFEVISQDDFSQNTVSLNAPEDNFSTNQVIQVLQWNAIQGATGYTIEIEDTATQTIVETTTILETSYEYTFTEGTFIWRIRAERDEQMTLFSERTIVIDTTVPNVPTLAMPVDMTIVTDSNVNFLWTRAAVEGSTEFDVISIYEDEDLTMLVEETQTTAPYSVMLPSGTYYWFVKGFDEAGNESERSTVFSFTIN